MTIYAVDPGPTRSGLVVLEGTTVRDAVVLMNDELLEVLAVRAGERVLAIEQIESMGMPVGREVFETVYWSGRMHEAWESHGGDVRRITRREVKLAICGQARANDGAIRRALLDRWGGDKAVGTKKHPGPLHTVKSHCWSALALAVTYTLTADVPPPE